MTMTTCKDHLEKYLREHQVKYETQHHPPAYTAQEVAASEHVPGRMVAKVVMVLADGNLVMLTLPAPSQVSFVKAKSVLGAGEVRLAEESEFADTFPDCEVGAMPPFGNLYDVPVYVDSSLSEDEIIYFDAGTHTDTMSVRSRAPRVECGAAHKLPARPQPAAWRPRRDSNPRHEA